MKQIKFLVTQYDKINETLFFVSHHRSEQILAAVSSEAQKNFYNLLLVNLNEKNIQPLTIREFNENSLSIKNKVLVLLDIPPKFEQMEQIIIKAQQCSEIIVLLVQSCKKYINMIKKKIFNKLLVSYIICEYSKNDIIGVNKKIREYVDQSYDFNRAAFSAYGAYINNFRANLCKFIFKTEDINVTNLAISYGFTTAPRVKEGKFLKADVRKENKKEKTKRKRMLKKQKAVKANRQEEAEEISGKGEKKLSSLQKIKLLAARKTKKIMKQKQKQVVKEASKNKVTSSTKPSQLKRPSGQIKQTKGGQNKKRETEQNNKKEEKKAVKIVQGGEGQREKKKTKSK